MARPNKQKIDHENLRDWLVCRPTEAGQVLGKIEETATATMKKYIQRYFRDGESIGEIAEKERVEPSTVSHALAAALERAGGWLVENLPKQALQRQKENELPPKAKRYLHMSEEEIVTDYREAKHKQLQIGILADRNLTTKAVIREVLREHGIDLPEPKKASRGKARKSVEPLPDVAATAAESHDETEGGNHGEGYREEDHDAAGAVEGTAMRERGVSRCDGAVCRRKPIGGAADGTLGRRRGDHRDGAADRGSIADGGGEGSLLGVPEEMGEGWKDLLCGGRAPR